MAYGTAFAYNEGVLCYRTNDQIRVLDIHGCSRTEVCVDTSRWKGHLTRTHPNESLSGDLHPGISHLSYTRGILACTLEISETDETWLVVLDLNHPEDPDIEMKRRLLLREHLTCTTKLFIRHDGWHLYYGTHSALGSHGHHEWNIQGFDLTTGHRLTEKHLQLVGFFGSELGSTVCFGIHNGFFHAISNQTSLEVEEVDWTSQYHCIQFALDEPNPNLTPRKLWRRQHKEGPINDSWTELSLQKDEQTDELLIVECRKEYMGGGSVNVRTYYTQPLSLSDDEEVPKNFGFPTNDPLTKTLDDNSNPNYEPAKKRIQRYCHPEYPLSRVDTSKYTSREFILAKTKFRTYSPATSSFIDLVNDPISRPGLARLHDRIRLRIASRVQKSPLIEDPDKPDHFLIRPKELNEIGVPIERSEEDFHPTELQDLWPPNDPPTELFDVLYPGGRVGQLDAMADDNAIVYMTGPSATHPNGERAIVLINFDPAWKHDGLRKVDLYSDRSTLVDMEVEKDKSGGTLNSLKRPSPINIDSDNESSPRKRQRKAAEAYAAGDEQQHKHQQAEIEPAQYLAVNRGFRFVHSR